MLTRREFGLGSLALAAVPAFGQGVKVLKVANTAGVMDAQQCFITSGQHPKINFYKAEGVDVEYVNMTSITQALQSLMTNQVHFGPMAPGILLPAMAKEPTLDLVAVYEWLPRNANVIVVKPGSPIKSAADLAGKKIGVRNQGDPGIVVTKTMLAELGLKDDKNEYIAIGDGAPAGAAIDNDRVDAMVTFDTAAARIELVGTKLRYVPLTPKFTKVGSSWICVPRKALQADRKAYVGLFRAMAKSTLFAHSNLDAAIDAHWGVYPESKPKGKTEDEARKEMKFILKDRKENWMRRPDDSDQRFGASSLEEWKAHIAVASETAKMPELAKQVDANKVFSNELIDEVNAFDRKAVMQMAQAFKA
ncbi:ABC transporter substrate-binding protein [Ramlibacter albus]|uniref:ABC transporter substrate-binding protein n=1 Tax=Ramlibacter albus TaxID=2079448 RepID=A0A923MDZ8_9BURK|nr:ABC transporter substrate-binding protein [Ramlibacter albus]MBC5767728.1 ABC transporter substrate-binding protein [Ramlibacter albus]